ncbi:hypothetical protein [Pelagicoccus sp. SDUM812003]|uniref:hypothetical protein n=1 Tax=Pelagicoccus sp. SDUM812003 TaxID=3041267 RepID=UPI00281069CE|nr:hypothetical protein [Pelagicoccus sp. SDUM812003]MDQ8205723.1 hypothetical protein [Pelagicoccus sp. SDUM812003]
MKIIEAQKEEIDGLRIWAGDTSKLTNEQISFCLALERIGGNAMPNEIANYCETTEEKIEELRKGVSGTLKDANSGRLWIG